MEGSVRVDLLGGTLDIAPINLILKKALTLNLATSLKAKVEILPLEAKEDGIEIHSKDYNSIQFFRSSDFTQEKGAGSTLLSSWANHYKSWKNYNLGKILIIKYEDLVQKTFNKFYEIVLYLNELQNIEIDEKKILDSIEFTKFDNLQKLEKKYGFEEATSSKTFFRAGKVGSWKKELSSDLSKKIEKYFNKEMVELNYL